LTPTGSFGHLAREMSWWYRTCLSVFKDDVMNASVEQSLIAKIRALSPQEVTEVENFVEFLASKSKKRAAMERLLAIVPALEAAGAEPMSEDQIAAEVSAARTERRTRKG